MAQIGTTIERLGQVGSTNDLMRQRAKQGAAEGLILTAEEQTAGRGRLGRAWLAPPGSSLLMSVLLRPTWLPPDAAYMVTMVAAVALYDVISQYAPAALKWPNDLLLGASPENSMPSRKTAGVLSELAIERGTIAAVILGIGINVNWSPSGVVDSRDLAVQATSVAQAAGHVIDRELLFAQLVAQLDRRYAALRRGQREAIFLAWRNHLSTIGQRVTIKTLHGAVQGVAEGVGADGALQVRDDRGLLHVITAGDVQA